MSAKYVPVKTTHFEFGGPIGATGMVFVLPIVVYYLFFSCQANSCTPFEVPVVPTDLDSYFNLDVLLIVLAWLALHVVFYFVLPGAVVQGLPLVDGSKLPYPTNGLAACTVSTIGAVLLHVNGVINLEYIYDHYLQFITASILVSTLLSIYLYASSFTGNKILAAGGNSGSFFYDFFIGRELNPRIGGLDLKFFCELRPGLIGWILVDLGLAAKQYAIHGYITNSMALVGVFQIWYVFDAFTSEAAILSTMDIIQDGFGYMLAFGDLVWVPFTYSLQARYLVTHPVDHTFFMVVVILLTKYFGFRIFRGANGQKDQFKRDPNHPSVAALKYIPTHTGSRLLADGWWGKARHINYFGDLLMGLSWCLTTGFDAIIPYYYIIYFTILLVHRERRDEHKCINKYKEDWKKYTALVPYRIIPYVY